MWPAEESWAGQVTVRSAQPLGTTARRRLRRRMEALDPHPTMPPAAMLFVRRLTMEAPAAPKLPVALEHGVRDRLAHMYETAARPAEGLSDPAAEAVVFPDEATMIACLLADIRRGWAPEFWWWRAVWSSGVLPRAAGAILAARPEQAPAVFRALDGMGEAVRVAALLEREQSVSLLRAVLASHAAPGLARAFDAARFALDLARNSLGVGHSPVPVAAARDAGFDLAVIPAGLPRLPRGGESLPPENRVLVALALGLAAAPQVIRSAEFAVCAGEWLRAEFSGVGAVTPSAAAARNTGVNQESVPENSRFETLENKRMEQAKREKLAAPRTRTAVEPVEDTQPDSPSREMSASAAQPQVEIEARLAERSVAASSIISEQAISARLPHVEAGIRTRLGGALYLIAAFEWLAIPECFEPAWPFSSYLSRWGVLELVTRGLVGAAGLTEAFQDDPLWAALARIDGRDVGLSGFQDTPAEHAFRVPAAWLPEILDPDEEFAWSSRQRRIAVWSRAGWLLADRLLEKGERREDAIRAELPPHCRSTGVSAERLSWAASPRAPLGGELRIAPALKFWLECTLPAIRVWLGRAMRLERPGYAELAESLLLVPGELFVTCTRIDFRAPLDQTRIPVRRAALDVDPGWLPAWGRSIRFHYGDASGGLR